MATEALTAMNSLDPVMPALARTYVGNPMWYLVAPLEFRMTMMLRMPEPMTAAMMPCHHFYRVMLVVPTFREVKSFDFIHISGFIFFWNWRGEVN